MSLESKNYKKRLVDDKIEKYLSVIEHSVLKDQNGVEKHGQL